jgi:hypothetical protein
VVGRDILDLGSYVAALLLWITARLIVTDRAVRSLKARVIALEEGGARPPAKAARARNAA